MSQTSPQNFHHNNILMTKGLVDYKEAIEMAYQILVRQVCKNKDDVMATIDKIRNTEPKADDRATSQEQNGNQNRYRIQLDLTEQRDFIILTTIDSKRHEFSRSKFLDKRRIKNDLIAYYKPLGLFVKPPQKQPNSNIWYIDLLFKTDFQQVRQPTQPTRAAMEFYETPNPPPVPQEEPAEVVEQWREEDPPPAEEEVTDNVMDELVKE